MTSNYLENGRYRLVEQFKTNYVPAEGLYPDLKDPIPLYEIVKAQAIQKNKIVLIKGTFDRATVVRDFALEQAAQLESAKHPNLLNYIDHFQENPSWGPSNMIFLVTEYAEGGTLRELIDHTKQAKPKARPENNRRGFSHEELEPENVFLCKDKICVKLGNLGSTSDLPASIYDPNEFVKLPYETPEQIRGDQNSKKKKSSDIYRFGMILQEMITGRHAFFYQYGNNTVDELRDSILNGTRDNCRLARGPDIDDFKDFLKIVDKCLNEDPIMRPSSDELALDLSFAEYIDQLKRQKDVTAADLMKNKNIIPAALKNRIAPRKQQLRQFGLSDKHFEIFEKLKVEGWFDENDPFDGRPKIHKREKLIPMALDGGLQKFNLKKCCKIFFLFKRR
ncbi:unnamed protein product [Oikopleura dioica]|uniref:Protein kinase domain-containing protein n=1 Tax=Oikopleura dioica TaxID=34765 RepID=E4WX02_OIKDI|nr:unnamed protein product [Oikopleura dioica]